MVFAVEDAALRQAALEYVVALWDELAAQNGAPTLGVQNQAVEFILADPALREAAAAWAARSRADEAATAPPQRLPQDRLYRCLRAVIEGAGAAAILVAPGGRSG